MDEDQTNAALSFTLRRDTVSAVLAVEGPITEILGYEPHELIGVTSVDLLHPADSDAGVTSWVQMLLGPTLEGRFRGRYRHRDGSWIWVDTHNVNKLDDPDFACVMSIITVTDEADVSIHEQLRAQREVLARLNELLPVGLLHVSIDGRVIESNQLLRDLVGVEDPRRLDDLIAAVAPADRGL
ncbi:MAG: PAS domain-containing protein, partial [Acidimicrobiales bacterium]